MKKLVGIAALLILTGFSIYAYTALTATSSITVTGQGNFATVSGGSLSWDVNYGPIQTPSTGTLYNITADDDYTGDLFVTVFLTNSGELVGSYRSLILELQLQNATGSQVGSSEYISLTEPEATFNMTYPWENDYTIEVTGGSYQIHPGGGWRRKLKPRILL